MCSQKNKLNYKTIPFVMLVNNICTQYYDFNQKVQQIKRSNVLIPGYFYPRELTKSGISKRYFYLSPPSYPEYKELNYFAPFVQYVSIPSHIYRNNNKVFSIEELLDRNFMYRTILDAYIKRESQFIIDSYDLYVHPHYSIFITKPNGTSYNLGIKDGKISKDNPRFFIKG